MRMSGIHCRKDVINSHIFQSDGEKSNQEQYIKPVTLKAGKVSWALMQHPDGLDCDLFISHAWQEGGGDAENQWIVVCDDLGVSYVFPGPIGVLGVHAGPYESTSVCRFSRLTTEVSLNF